MARRTSGVALLDRVEAVLRNPALYALAEAIPEQKAGGGRPRDYPPVMLLVFEALISVYGSARQVEAELGHPVIWDQVRRAVKQEADCELPTPAHAPISLPLRPQPLPGRASGVG